MPRPPQKVVQGVPGGAIGKAWNVWNVSLRQASWQSPLAGLFVFEHTLTGTEWAHIAVTGVTWLLIPLLIGLALVMRSEVK